MHCRLYDIHKVDLYGRVISRRSEIQFSNKLAIYVHVYTVMVIA